MHDRSRHKTRPRILATAIIGVATLLCSVACGSKSAAPSNAAAPSTAAAGSSKSPIVIGYVGDLTGVASSTFADGLGGAEARIDLQNAKGGIDGRKLKLVSADTTSTAPGAATAVHYLTSVQHVFGIIEDSAFFFGGSKVAQQAKIPVTGYAIDGPEWYQQPNTNLFDVIPATSLGAIDGVTYADTTRVQFLKQTGVTKFAIFGYGISPSSTTGVEGEVYAAKKIGLPLCEENLGTPFGGVDFTASVLKLKSEGCNGYDTSFVDASDIAFGQAVKNAADPMKAQLMSEGYDNNVLESATARAAINGDYFESYFNFTNPNAATQTMLNALKTYDKGFTGVPDLGLYGGYLGADGMIFGLQHTGANPTPASFITNLRQVGSYNADGVLATPTTFQHFGTADMLAKTDCEYFVQLKGSQFTVTNNNKPLCGSLLPVPASALKS